MYAFDSMPIDEFRCILRDQWSPALTCRTIILSIINLMIEPDPDDPLEPEIAALYSLNRPRYSLNAY